jgi:flagellar basal body-associated protein FliL
MKNDKIVTINGQKFDQESGLPLEKAKPSLRSDISKPRRLASDIRPHKTYQPNRVVTKNSTQKSAIHSSSVTRKTGRNFDIARSKDISRFSPNTTSAPSKTAVKAPTLEIPKFDGLSSIENRVGPASAQKNMPPKSAKETAIAEAFAKLDAQKVQEQQKSKKRSKLALVISFVAAVVVILGIGAYVYLSIPSLSVGLAGAQAGIDAAYPEYTPEGYSLTRPIEHSDNQVATKFSSTTNSTYFVIKQTKSSWDSTAVKNQVEKDSNGVFITTEERGLTIYSYSGNAAWVNGGILYTITGDAALTSDQIRRIATSL